MISICMTEQKLLGCILEIVKKNLDDGKAEDIAVIDLAGKTSIADFVRQILTMMNLKAASMGTLGLIKGREAPIPSPNTTPNAAVIAEELAGLKKEGYDYAVMEMSSHGLCQYRTGGVHNVKVAGFTTVLEEIDLEK